MKQKGFTLIELLVVIAIIGILSSVVLASLNVSRTRSRDAKRIADLRQIQLALEQYYDVNGVYPFCGNAGALYCCSPALCGGAGRWLRSGAGPSLEDNLLPYMQTLSVDPINTNTTYGYYYIRGYKQTGPSTYTNTGSAGDYVLATRLEITSNPVLTGPNWNNPNVNYMVGN